MCFLSVYISVPFQVYYQYLINAKKFDMPNNFCEESVSKMNVELQGRKASRWDLALQLLGGFPLGRTAPGKYTRQPEHGPTLERGKYLETKKHPQFLVPC